MVVVVTQMHPNLLFLGTTATGGDTGAHVALPAYLKSHLLTHGQLTGWDPGWYDGFPIYTFYFPLPGLLTVALNGVFSYDVAFKLVTILGSLLLPLSAWAFGRLAGLRDPGPGCLAAASSRSLSASRSPCCFWGWWPPGCGPEGTGRLPPSSSRPHCCAI